MCGHLDRGFAHGQRLVDLILADNFPHRGLGRFPDGFFDIRHVEQVVLGLADFVLDDEFHGENVHVSGQHEGFLRDDLRPATGIGAKPDFDAVELLNLRRDDGFKKGDLQMGTRLDGPNHVAEPLDEPFFVRVDLEDRLREDQDSRHDQDDGFHPPGRLHSLPLFLGFIEDVIKRIGSALLTPWISWFPRHTVVSRKIGLVEGRCAC